MPFAGDVAVEREPIDPRPRRGRRRGEVSCEIVLCDRRPCQERDHHCSSHRWLVHLILLGSRIDHRHLKPPAARWQAISLHVRHRVRRESRKWRGDARRQQQHRFALFGQSDLDVMDISLTLCLKLHRPAWGVGDRVQVRQVDELRGRVLFSTTERIVAQRSRKSRSTTSARPSLASAQ